MPPPRLIAELRRVPLTRVVALTESDESGPLLDADHEMRAGLLR